MKKHHLFSLACGLALYLALGLVSSDEAVGKGKPDRGTMDPRIVYQAQHGGWRIMVANVDGTRRIVVVDNNGRNLNPSWSHDGNHIIFASDADGPGVYCVTIDRASGLALTPARKIVELSGDAIHWAKPIWSPVPVGASYKVAYANYDANGYLSIYLQDITDCVTPLGEAIELRNLGYDSHYKHYHNPSWSPNGDQIAFLARVDEDILPYYDVQVMTLGQCGSMICDTARKSLIQGLDPATEGYSPLLDSSTDLFSPEWGDMPGLGSAIAVDAYLDLAGEGDANVWIIPVDDPASAFNLTIDTPDFDDHNPAWSPDGTEIIYSSRFNECKLICRGKMVIVKRNADGSPYSDGRIEQELIKEKYHVFNPKWWGPQ